MLFFHVCFQYKVSTVFESSRTLRDTTNTPSKCLCLCSVNLICVLYFNHFFFPMGCIFSFKEKVNSR